MSRSTRNRTCLDLSRVFVCFFPSRSLFSSLFLITYFTKRCEFVMFQRLKMGGVEMFHQLDLNGIETECPKVFQHCLSAKTTGLDLILTAWAAKEVVQLETELPQGVVELWMTTSQIGVDRTGR